MGNAQNLPNFYLVNNWARHNATGKKFLNGDEVCRGTGSSILSPPSIWDRGFRNYTIRPRFLISKRLGLSQPDIEQYLSFWFISEAAKRLLDEFCPQDFVYLAIDTEVDSGCEPVTYWLSDIVNVLDAVDEEKSSGLEVKIADNGKKLHQSPIYGSTELKLDVVGGHQVFRLETSPHTIVCTKEFKEMYKSAGLKGQPFLPAREPSFDTVGTVTALHIANAPIGNEKTPGWHGQITPDGRGKVITFLSQSLEDTSYIPSLGDKVRVEGRRMKWSGRGLVARRIVKL